MSKTVYSAKKNHKPKVIPKSKKIIQNIKKDLKKLKDSEIRGFTSFPKKIRFENQEYKEEIILFLRRHLITNTLWIFISLILILIPMFVKPLILLSFMPARFRVFTLVIWYIFILIYVLENFLSWYFNVYIITDERVIDVDFYSLVYKHISETKIDRIEDVTYTQGGFTQSFFNYGLVNIQTSGEITEFEFESVPNPAQIAKVLNQLILQEEQEKIEGRIS